MFPEPNIYAFAPHIFCIQNWRCNMYYLNRAYLIARSAPFIIQLLPICCQYILYMPILRLRLEVRYVFSWPTYLIARSAPSYDLIIAYLLPVYVCRFRVLRLEVQFVLLWPAHLIVNILYNVYAEDFLLYPSTYLEKCSLLPIFYITFPKK